MTLPIPDQDTFLSLPAEAIYELVYPQQLSISLLLNGTRRWYVSQHFSTPPENNSYLPHYLNTVLVRLTGLFDMLVEHGLQRIFVPVYSDAQEKRDTVAYQYLIKGIEALTAHPYLTEMYQRTQTAVRFYGDTTLLEDKMDTSIFKQKPSEDAKHTVFYDVNTGNPYNHLLRLAYEFSIAHQRPPAWEDMLEMYYGDRSLRRLDILIAFNRIYSRVGLPHLLEGNDRIYLTVVTPLVMSQNALRRVLYDYLYNHQDPGRNYSDIHPNELYRLKRFYEANQETVVGLTKKFEDFCYPLPGPTWPAEMEAVAAVARRSSRL